MRRARVICFCWIQAAALDQWKRQWDQEGPVDLQTMIDQKTPSIGNVGTWEDASKFFSMNPKQREEWSKKSMQKRVETEESMIRKGKNEDLREIRRARRQRQKERKRRRMFDLLSRPTNPFDEAEKEHALQEKRKRDEAKREGRRYVSGWDETSTFLGSINRHEVSERNQARKRKKKPRRDALGELVKDNDDRRHPRSKANHARIENEIDTDNNHDDIASLENFGKGFGPKKVQKRRSRKNMHTSGNPPAGRVERGFR
mmetsp:Transcript_1727/g.3326  ORF Transcript_1727/g.3326 Transcript_1727/m.3326 type:complete len:258 (-) Transcript_1727:80-853(-)